MLFVEFFFYALPKDINKPPYYVVTLDQVGVYGPGGHYLPHYDTLVLDEASLYNSQGLWVGNR